MTDTGLPSFRIDFASVDDFVVAYAERLASGVVKLRTSREILVGSRIELKISISGETDVVLPCLVRRTASDPTGTRWAIEAAFANIKEARTRLEAILGGQASTIAPPPRQQLTVVVADDADAMRKLASAPFETRGDTVHRARNGVEALALCIKHAPDVLLSDVQMPSMDGWQLLRMIRARPQLSHMPVLFLTTLSSETDRLKGYHRGVDDYISKPFRPTDLVARVDRAVLRTEHSKQDSEGLHGDLEQVGLASLLSFLEVERRSGILKVEGRTTSTLELSEGFVVHIDPCPGKAGDALFALLDITKGTFEFVQGNVTRSTPVCGSLSSMLIEHARRQDEGA